MTLSQQWNVAIAGAAELGHVLYHDPVRPAAAGQRAAERRRGLDRDGRGRGQGRRRARERQRSGRGRGLGRRRDRRRARHRELRRRTLHVHAESPTSTASDSFTYTITDGRGGNDTGTVEVTVEPVNDAPVLDNSGSPTLTSIAEDSGVSGGTRWRRSLPPCGRRSDHRRRRRPFEGIAVTGTDSSNGTWEYSTSGGEGWSPVGSVERGGAPAAPCGQPCSASSRAGDFNGSATLEFRAWDESTRARRGHRRHDRERRHDRVQHGEGAGGDRGDGRQRRAGRGRRRPLRGRGRLTRGCGAGRSRRRHRHRQRSR